MHHPFHISCDEDTQQFFVRFQHVIFQHVFNKRIRNNWQLHTFKKKSLLELSDNDAFGLDLVFWLLMYFYDVCIPFTPPLLSEIDTSRVKNDRHEIESLIKITMQCNSYIKGHYVQT